jgi:small-conductance mechanosensitive channel
MLAQLQTNPALQVEFLGNTAYEWLIAVVIFFIAIAVLKIFQLFIIGRLKALSKKTKTEVDDIIINAIHAIHWPFYVIAALYFSLKYLAVSEAVDRWAGIIIIIGVIYYAVRVAQEFVDIGAKRIIKKKMEADETDTQIVEVLSTVVKFLLWIVAILMLLSNLGFNINSLIAGLGIGGLAVALALQNVLSDLFSAVSIYFDKPFKVGEFIIIGDHMGIVKKIGVKTTRIQTLQGEELIVSNNELTSIRVQNFGRMERRRIVFSVGVTYDTPHAKLEKIPNIIKEVIEKHKITEVDRIHFKEFGDSSLNYEIVYYVNAPEYPTYMDTQQAINLDIVEAFEKDKIEIAFPTRTVYVKK